MGTNQLRMASGRRTMGRRIAWGGRMRPVEVRLHSAAYSKAVVVAAAHRYSGRFAVVIRMDGDDWLVHLEVPPDTEPEALQGEFLRAALDEQLRELVRGRTAPLHDALISAALANMHPQSGGR
jgi:His-Xaa-Ser system protein HxsD